MQNRIKQLLHPFEAYEPSDSFDFPERWREPLQALLEFVSSVEPEQADRWFAEYPMLSRSKPKLFHLYARYIRSQELDEMEKLQTGSSRPTILEVMGDFGRQSYARVRDMFDNVDFTDCRRFVMVGCGSLPVTMLHVMEKTTVPEIVGLDIDKIALSLNRTTIRSIAAPRMTIQKINGCGYNYDNADVVYIANLVHPKREVLRQVAETAPDGTQVVLRDPYSMGKLFAESGTDVLDDRFKIAGEGVGNVRFLSRHVFLKLDRNKKA